MTERLYRCAMLMMDAAESASALAEEVNDPDLRDQLTELADSLISTKHDVVHDLFELTEATDHDKAAILERCERWIDEDLEAWRCIGASISETDLVVHPHAMQLAIAYAKSIAALAGASDVSAQQSRTDSVNGTGDNP